MNAARQQCRAAAAAGVIFWDKLLAGRKVKIVKRIPPFGQLGLDINYNSWWPQPALAPPSIVLQPVSRMLRANAPATFQIVATGQPPLFYQWHRNGAPMLGATNDSLSVLAVRIDDGGSYDAVASNAFGTAASASLAIETAPETFFASFTTGQSLTLQMNGKPNFPYILESATNLSPPVSWTSVATNAADSNGVWSCTDTNLTTGDSQF